MAFNGFFGQITGPFRAGQKVFNAIMDQCNQNINYISKIGIHYPVNFDLNLPTLNNENEEDYSFLPIQIKLYDAEEKVESIFLLGRTGMLELQDVKITAIQFINNVDDNIYIDYQYISN